MAWPRYIAGEDTAKDKLIEAFWLMLEGKNYRDITVKDVYTSAGVNKNTYYYHFSDLNQLADAAIARLFTDDFPLTLMLTKAGRRKALQEFDPGTNLRIRRAWLCVSPHGTGLRKLLERHLAKAWLAAKGLRRKDVSDEEALLAEFAIGGYVSLLQGATPKTAAETFRLASRSAGIMACMAELEAIECRSAKQESAD